MLQSTYMPMPTLKETTLAGDLSGESDFFLQDSWTGGFFDGTEGPSGALRELAVLYVSDLAPTQLIAFENIAETGGSSATQMLADVVCRHLSLGTSTQWMKHARQESIQHPWVSLAYSECDELSFGQIQTIVNGISEAFRQDRFSDVDKSLSNANPERMSADAIVTLAHMSIAAKDHLPSLKEFISRSRISFANRGTEDFLEGLE